MTDRPIPIRTNVAPSIRVLVTGSGAPGAPGVLRCLQLDPSLDIVLCDANPSAVGKYLARDFFVVPHASDEAFIPAVLAECLARGIRIIMPLVTRELQVFAAAAETFRQFGIDVLVSEASALSRANNKSHLYHALDTMGIAVPAYQVVHTIADFERAAHFLGFPDRPFCFKPSLSNGSRGFRIVNAQVDEHDLLFNAKPSSTNISYHDAVRILGKRPFPELLLSEVLPGDEYSVDCLLNHGHCLIALPRLRSRIINGISVEGCFVRDTSIIEYSTAVVEGLGLHGNIGVQVKRAADGRALILEINPRVQGTTVAALGAGVNLPLLAVQQLLGYPLPAEVLQPRWGTHFVRHWTEVYF